MKTILAISSGRWDYGYLLPILKELEKNEDVDLCVFSPCELGYEDYIKRVSYFNNLSSFDQSSYFYSVCKARMLMEKPNAVLLLGDRWEIQIAASIATVLDIPIAHIHGGEVTYGSVDNELRNSITMMAKWHFVATEKAANNVMRMLRSPFDVYETGSPTIDYLNSMDFSDKHRLNVVANSLMLTKQYIIAAFNPVTKELANIEGQITRFLDAIDTFTSKKDYQIVMIMPNADPKNDEIRRIINEKRTYMPQMRVRDSINRDDFLHLLKNSRMIVGNSSAGIIEAGYLGVPTVNVGNRQSGRECSSSVYHCSYSAMDIGITMDVADTNRPEEKPKNYVYGNGGASRIIANVLATEIKHWWQE